MQAHYEDHWDDDRYADDYTNDDRYDWEISDPSQRCVHGTFIGSLNGPDLICGYCEDGTTLEDLALWHLADVLEKFRLETLWNLVWEEWKYAAYRADEDLNALFRQIRRG
jgi:hypothetical protein